MPTNDERREVARRLRDLSLSSTELTNDVLLNELYIIVTPRCFWSMGDAWFLNRLADLIEPEERTCQRGTEMFSHAYPNEIVCDSDCVSTYVFPLTCGHEVELLENEWPNYCPNCGAKVVDEDA